MDATFDLESETPLEDATEENRTVPFAEEVDAIELVVVNVTFEISTVLFPVTEGGCQRISQDSALIEAGAVVHMRSAPSQTVKPF